MYEGRSIAKHWTNIQKNVSCLRTFSVNNKESTGITLLNPLDYQEENLL